MKLIEAAAIAIIIFIIGLSFYQVYITVEKFLHEIDRYVVLNRTLETIYNKISFENNVKEGSNFSSWKNTVEKELCLVNSDYKIIETTTAGKNIGEYSFMVMNERFTLLSLVEGDIHEQ